MSKHLDTMMVLTANQKATLLQEGGSGDWRFAAWRARNTPYIVCTSSAPYERGRGFLIGKVSGVKPADTKGRLFIEISEYADINVPHMWGGDRNPNVYVSSEDLQIDFSKLEWKPVTQAKNATVPAVETHQMQDVDVGVLTIDTAKLGLAKGLGVPVSAIKITIEA